MFASDESRGGMTYRDAGVDIDAQDDALERIKRHVASTKTDGVLSDLGSFGGLHAVPGNPSQVMVASTDGVGTKVLVAQRAGKHDTVGQDLVNHCVDDILVMGARPLFFQDYFAVGKLDPQTAERVVAGVATACRENSCALLGGETAEMPDIYAPGHYDLAGTIVGIVDRDHVIDGQAIQAGDRLIGLASTGLHTNGYTLARKLIFDVMQLDLGDALPDTDQTVEQALLAIHKSYYPVLSDVLSQPWLRGLAHITGGGLPDNLKRVVPDGLQAVVRLGSWTVPPIFDVLRRAGDISESEMLRAFNMGVGMVVVVEDARAAELTSHLDGVGQTWFEIGRVESSDGAPVGFEGSLA